MPTTPATIADSPTRPASTPGSAPGFWTGVWRRVRRRPAATLSLAWIAFVATIAALAPLLASGHPLVAWEIDELGVAGPLHFPLLARLTATDRVLLLGCALALVALAAPGGPAKRSRRFALLLAAAAQAGVIVLLGGFVESLLAQRDAPAWARALDRTAMGDWGIAAGVALIASAPFALLRVVTAPGRRLGFLCVVGGLSGLALWSARGAPGAVYDYAERVSAGRLVAVYTLAPWSADERPRDRDAQLLPPGSTSDQALLTNLVTGLPIVGQLDAGLLARVGGRLDSLPLPPVRIEELRLIVDRHAARAEPPTRRELEADLSRALGRGGRPYHLGTDSFGQDVLAQMIHACRLAVSIGLVSTGIATLIGVTLGALMGYFGGIVDLLLSRVVEIFMAVPLLFILIVAAGTLPPEYRTTHAMMAIIGCFTWTGAARYTRAEFYRLRDQDFVHAARAAGLPLRSILFRHILPSGVTPVLVEASFSVAFAIILEATLSFLGLGPTDQASWGRLLADATGPVGDFVWWLAIFPGLAIFLAALSYNLLGEALRDAIDPRLSKPRV